MRKKAHAPAKRPGRPSHLTPEKITTICGFVARGTTPDRAATLAGVASTTWRDWKTWGAAGREPYCSAVAQVFQAEAAALAESEARVRAAGQGGEWKADAWLLERRDRATYSQRLEVRAGPVDVDPEQLSDADLERIIASGRLAPAPDGGPE